MKNPMGKNDPRKRTGVKEVEPSKMLISASVQGRVFVNVPQEFPGTSGPVIGP